MNPQPMRRLLRLALVLVVGLIVAYVRPRSATKPTVPTTLARTPPPVTRVDRDTPNGAPQPPPHAQNTQVSDSLARAIRDHADKSIATGAGSVMKLLPDDIEGDRHQRFLVKLDDGRTILVAHNIDVAPKVPMDVRDRIEFKGEYIWNEQGGVVHWTHRDPRHHHADGWLKLNGKQYD